MVYLDSAATSKYNETDSIIVNEITDAMNEYWQNPSSLYAIKVKERINECRTNIAKFINAKSDEICFTSGASESNNWCIRGWVDKEMTDDCGFINIITTLIEHKSILEAVKNPNLGVSVRYCNVDECGLVDYDSLRKLLSFRKGEPILVSIGMANNEIGTIQDIKRISELVHGYGGILHVDATQALGHIPIDVSELGIDMMSASGHKISPVLRGIGFLYKRSGVDIQPLIYGAQENGLRGGTELTYGIIGLSKALELCDVGTQKIQEMCDKRDYFIQLLKSKFDIQLNGHPTQRLPNNINIIFPQNITGESLLYTLEMSDILISTGSACNSKEIKPSYVLKAIGLNDTDAMKSVRFTLPDDITYEEIRFVVDEIDKAIRLIEV
jgi:cysteine desulfurase